MMEEHTIALDIARQCEEQCTAHDLPHLVCVIDPKEERLYIRSDLSSEQLGFMLSALHPTRSDAVQLGVMAANLIEQRGAGKG